ncbi:MAG: hypothetical protein HN904_07995 [Victivallales bacterium]|nr:hypothetical protein [Victivallales bacterium]
MHRCVRTQCRRFRVIEHVVRIVAGIAAGIVGHAIPIRVGVSVADVPGEDDAVHSGVCITYLVAVGPAVGCVGREAAAYGNAVAQGKVHRARIGLRPAVGPRIRSVHPARHPDFAATVQGAGLNGVLQIARRRSPGRTVAQAARLHENGPVRVRTRRGDDGRPRLGRFHRNQYQRVGK